jgi:hypothetical protein
VSTATLEEIFISSTPETTVASVRAPRRRMRGLRIAVLPSWPLLTQLGGGAAALGGIYLQWGVAVTMIVGGVVAAGLGALREGGKI